MTLKNGTRYEGHFSDNVFSGEGEFDGRRLKDGG